MAERILVINDTEDILLLFKDLLEGEGYTVVLYSYAPQDVDTVARVQPDLIILDLVFGEEKAGWQLLEKIKLRRATAHIPMLVCTAAVQAVREQEGYLASHGVGVMLKPFDIDELLAAIRHALSLRDSAAGVVDETPPQGERK